MVLIPNHDLKESDLPSPQAEWRPDIWKLATSFDGYGYWGSFQKCGEIANNRQHDTLTELRTCLFFEWRRAAHSGSPPTGEQLEYVRELVEKIRAKVIAEELL